jgi:hypothetical protein
MNSSNDCVVVMCPPYPEYQEAPEDHSHSELFDCPKCNSQMWLSEKKKGVLMFSSCLNKEIILGCYNCVKRLLEEPSLSTAEILKVDI